MAPRTKNPKKRPKAAKNSAKRKAILDVAERVFAGKSFHKATISEIAKGAHVSESTIYEYFSTKEDLLFSIPAETIREYHNKHLEILQYIQGAANKLRTLIYRHLSLYTFNEDYVNVAMLILKGNRNFLKTEAYKVVQASARITTKAMEEGIEAGEFRSDLQPHLVRAMIWGTIEHLIKRKSLLGKPEDLLPLADVSRIPYYTELWLPKKSPFSMST